MVRKCKKHAEFEQELEQMEEAYSHDLNMAIYASLDDVEGLGVFQLHSGGGSLIVSFFAYLMPPFEELAPRFYLLWVRMLDETLRYLLAHAG